MTLLDVILRDLGIRLVKRRRRVIARRPRREYLENREKARLIAHERIDFFNKSYGFKFNSIRIKNQKSRWGSCSKRGNINFNYQIATLPQHLSDYIIVHELCHLGAFNHSKAFWDLVSKTIPNHRAIRAEFKKLRLHP